MNLSDQRYLVETDWLQDHLDEPELRLVECMSLIPNYFEPSRRGRAHCRKWSQGLGGGPYPQERVCGFPGRSIR